MRSRGDGFLHNGRMAWEMPRRIGARYLGGVYLSPPGWDPVAKFDPSWHRQGDYIVRKTLAPPVVEARAKAVSTPKSAAKPLDGPPMR